jgi:ABC-type Fe3+/spermidine/putrescine transport system ATPase subunit
VLRLQHISKRFGSFAALDDLSLEILEGEVFTLLGPSGCGKTTTLRIIAGLEQPDRGRVLLRDKPIVSVDEGIYLPTHRRNMGMVFQSYAIWPHKTVFENVAYPLRVRGVRSAEIRQRVLHILDVVGLSGLAQRQGPQLSGGQQQRVALARALVYEPSVLLLDEPFSNLDSRLREQMRLHLRQLLKEVNVTALFVTHDQSEALSLSDRIAVMNGGRLEQVGPPRDLYERPATAFVRDFLGRTILLPGLLVSSLPDGHLTVRVPDLPEGELIAYVGRGLQFTQDQPVLAAIRPEDVELVASANGNRHPNELVGIVESALFMGDHVECRVRLGASQTLSLNTPRGAVTHEGMPIRLAIAPEHVGVWPR